MRLLCSDQSSRDPERAMFRSHQGVSPPSVLRLRCLCLQQREELRRHRMPHMPADRLRSAAPGKRRSGEAAALPAAGELGRPRPPERRRRRSPPDRAHPARTRQIRHRPLNPLCRVHGRSTFPDCRRRERQPQLALQSTLVFAPVFANQPSRLTCPRCYNQDSELANRRASGEFPHFPSSRGRQTQQWPKAT